MDALKTIIFYNSFCLVIVFCFSFKIIYVKKFSKHQNVFKDPFDFDYNVKYTQVYLMPIWQLYELEEVMHGSSRKMTVRTEPGAESRQLPAPGVFAARRCLVSSAILIPHRTTASYP